MNKKEKQWAAWGVGTGATLGITGALTVGALDRILWPEWGIYYDWGALIFGGGVTIWMIYQLFRFMDSK
jgi:hypothetical protein